MTGNDTTISNTTSVEVNNGGSNSIPPSTSVDAIHSTSSSTITGSASENVVQAPAETPTVNAVDEVTTPSPVSTPAPVEASGEATVQGSSPQPIIQGTATELPPVSQPTTVSTDTTLPDVHTYLNEGGRIVAQVNPVIQAKVNEVNANNVESKAHELEEIILKDIKKGEADLSDSLKCALQHIKSAVSYVKTHLFG